MKTQIANRLLTPCCLVTSTSRPLSFGMRLRNEHYSPLYKQNPYYNGPEADAFVLARLQERFPDPPQTLVWDIGSGDGRNTLPIAQAGYRVVSTEMSKQGQRIIQEKAEYGGFSDRIHLDESNILEPGLSASGEDKHPIHLAILSRVSMHFSLDEMKQVFTNVWQQLVPNGLFILNALIRKPNYDTMYRELFDSELEGSGCNNFKPNELHQAIEESQFITERIEDHEKPKTSDPVYMNHLHWGMFSDFLNKEAPVWLKWYVLRKPSKK